jgi:endoglucanase
VALVAAAIAQAVAGVPAQARNFPAGTQFYVDPNSQAARWVAGNPGDPRAAAIDGRIAQVPSGIWFSSYSPSTVTASVSAVTSAAKAAGRTPVLVVYEIPNRDCGGASAGGAPDLTAYGNWVRSFAAGLNSAPVVVILEPDSLALQTCLSTSDAAARDNAIALAVTTIKGADAAAKVYLDAGHSAWNSASDQAGRLNAAGVRSSDGIFSNVSNFNLTGNEVNFDRAVLAALGSPANLHAVVDTSRNGNGSNGQWCDPSGRALGAAPTAATGDAAIDAYLWVKPPGEADGCADPAGVFDPALAYALITNGPPVSPSPSPTRTVSPSPTPSLPPSPSPSRTTSPSPTGGSGGPCHVTYGRQSEWPSGFVAQVAIADTGTAPIVGWTLTFRFGGDQVITNAWNATASQSGSAVTLTSLSYNGTIAPGQSTSVGFQGTWSASDASPTSFSVNGVACS